MRRLALWGVFLLLTMVSAFAVTVDAGGRGAGNDELGQNFYIDGVTTGFTANPQNVLYLLDGDGLNPTSLFDDSSDPLVCDVDSSIPNNEIIYTYDNYIHFYNSAGQLLKRGNWPSPQTPPTCADTNGDGYDEVHGIIQSLGTPIYQVYGDTGGGSLGVLSQNSLVGFGSRYADVVCLEAEHTPENEGYCSFSTDQQFRLYQWDSGAGNMGLTYSTSVDTTLGWSSSKYINTAEAFGITPTTNDYYIMFSRGEQAYRLDLDLDTATAGSLQNVTFPGERIHDFVPLVANYRGGFANEDMQQYHNSSVLISNGPGSTYVTNVFMHPTFSLGTTGATTECIERTPADTNEKQMRVALFDDDEDGYLDVAWHCAAPRSVVGGVESYGFTRIVFYNGLTHIFAGQRATADEGVFFWNSASVPGWGDYETYDYPLVHDVDGDGDLELFVSAKTYKTEGATPHPDYTHTFSSYLQAGDAAYTTHNFNMSAGTNKMVFGDVNEDGYYDVVWGNAYSRHISGTAVESEPEFSVSESSPTPFRCSSNNAEPCAVIEDEEVNYTVTLSDADSPTLYVSYDCDSRYAPAPSPLVAVTTNTFNFTCDYSVIGESVETEVWVDDEALYKTSVIAYVDVTTVGGVFCNFNGVFEPELGETPENCLADYEDVLTPLELEEQANETAAANARQDLLTDAGLQDANESFLTTTLNEDGTIEASGTAADLYTFVKKLVVYFLYFLPFLLAIFLLAGLISRWSK